MAKSYTKEQLQKVYEKLPEELQEAMFSMETSDHVRDACTSRGIQDERLGRIAEYVGQVLMGLVLPQEFEQILQKEIKLPKQTAQEIAREINRFVFYPVRPALEQLHSMEIEVSARVVTPEPPAAEEAQEQRKEEGSKGPDTYREPIE